MDPLMQQGTFVHLFGVDRKHSFLKGVTDQLGDISEGEFIHMLAR